MDLQNIGLKHSHFFHPPITIQKGHLGQEGRFPTRVMRGSVDPAPTEIH